MEVIEKRLDELTPYENNPRVNDGAVEAVAESLKKFGWKQPLVVDRSGVIIVGHTRLKAAERLGWETAPVVIAEDLTEEEARAYRLADNKTAELADWNFQLLDEELAGINEIDMAAFGFDLTEPENPEDIEEDDFDPDDTPPERVKPGELWALGDHRLMCGDSTSEEDLDRLCGGAQPVMVFTDPPYGVSIGTKNDTLNVVKGTNYNQVRTDIKNDTLSPKELEKLLIAAFKNLVRVCDESCAYYISGPQGGELGLAMQLAFQKAGIPPRHILIWVKNVQCFTLGRLDYEYRHEPIYYTWTKKHNWYGGSQNTIIDDTKRLEDMNKAELKELVHALRDGGETSVIYCDKPLHASLHPTMKPVKLVARFLINSSKEGDLVADIFGGSGTTIIAAEQLKRRCIMMELDPHYCDVIIKRWEDYTGKKAERIKE